MPWNPAQHRLFEAAAHSPSVARRVGIPQSKAANMASEGIKRSRGGLAYAAEGGDQTDWRKVAAGAGAAGAGGLGALAVIAPGRFNRIARALQRPLTKPAFATEAVNGTPLSPQASRARYALARENVDHEFASLPAEEGQGAWQNGQGQLEQNPVYSQQLPRAFGRMDQNLAGLQYASRMGQLLDQEGVPLTRAMPNAINVPDAANAILLNNVGKDKIKQLAKGLGSDFVVAHQPDSKALIFPITDKPPPIDELAARIKAIAPQAKIRFAGSDPGVDRVLTGRQDWMDVPYSKFGANPRNKLYADYEKNVLNDPSSWSGLPLPDRQSLD